MRRSSTSWAVVAAAASHAACAQEPPPIQAGVAPPAGVYAPGIDVLHYDIEIGVGASEAWIAGRTRVRVLVTRADAVLPLDFTGLDVLAVDVRGVSSAPDDTADGVLSVPLQGAHAGDTVEVSVAYRGVPDDGLVVRDNVHGARAIFADNWPNRARFWFPSVDHPADKATARFVVHAPRAWRVVANGRLVGGPTPTADGAVGPASVPRSTWVWDEGVPVSTYNMVIGAADMTVRTVGLAACGRAPASTRPDGCVEVSYWVFPEDADRAAPSFRRAADIVDYFAETVGPYPFEKLANVQSATRFGGMENASAIFYAEDGIARGRNIEGTVSHETAHQWFGDGVTEADWHHLWLSEGFATYFGSLFFEHADGEADFRRRMEDDRRTYLASDVVDRPIVDPEEHDLFALLNRNNYEKGAWVLHMLRGVLGDSTFFAGIRTYYADHVDGTALTEDLQHAMEHVSGQDLGWFFRQWIHQPGYPVFHTEQQWEPAASGGTLVLRITQVQRPSWPRFRMPLEIAATAAGQEHRTKVEVTGQDDVYRIPLPARPDRVVLDPDGWVLKGDPR